jgi:ubiquinone biosynthesis protein COQ4
MAAQSHDLAPTASSTAATSAPRKRDWRRAWKAIGVLLKDSERTDQVFEILDALEGPTDELSFRVFATQPEGQRLLEEKPDLLAVLSDHDGLRALPEGSFGRTYLAFMEEANLNARDLVEAELAQSGGARPLDADRRWRADRGRDSHDLWHVLSGYGRDEAGEAALLAFTYANYRNHGIALILLMAALVGPKTLRFEWERYLWQAYRRGVKADLDFARYEDWLPLPLEEVRQRAHIVSPDEAHPGVGIVTGGRESGEITAFAQRD